MKENKKTEHQPYKPLLVVCLPYILTPERYNCINEIFKINQNIQESGWTVLAIDGFDKMDVRAFGVPENRLEDFEALKKLIEEKLKQ